MLFRSKLENARATWENAWRDAGKELRNERPYLSRSALREYLLKDDKKEAYIKQAMKPNGGKMLQTLLEANYVEEFEYGWIVCSDANASGLRIAL